jgi:hypothetical protein
MEKQITEIPVLQKSKATKMREVKPESSCCAQSSPNTACCTPSKTKEDNNGACCAQPEDGSACCDK